MNIECLFNIKRLDHYAIHVLDVEKSKRFHLDCLGFRFIKSYEINTCNDSQNNDTISIVLEKRTIEGAMVCVLNSPLNEFSFLNSSISKYGEGIHHVAYEVKNIEEEFAKGLKNGIKFTTNEIVIDKNNSLKQIFIDNQYTGYFFELIERIANVNDSIYNNFSKENIKNLMLSTSKK